MQLTITTATSRPNYYCSAHSIQFVYNFSEPALDLSTVFNAASDSDEDQVPVSSSAPNESATTSDARYFCFTTCQTVCNVNIK